MLLRLLMPALILLSAIASSSPARSQTPLPEDAVRRVTRQFERLINVRKVRYMEGRCEDAEYDKWAGFPLRKCTYMRQGDNDTAPKVATVIMLNAPAERLARWVVSACVVVKGRASNKCTNYLLNAINTASSAGQFPVAGLVLEDQRPIRKLPDGRTVYGNGKYEWYAFRDGVTVNVTGVPNGEENTLPTEAHIQAALFGEVKGSGKYGRIISTTREDYTANGGTVDVGTSAAGNRKLSFLSVVRDLYQTAWGSDRNELIIAFARFHKSKL